MKASHISRPGKLAFPHLSGLLGGWFHQDFDADGNTLEEIVGLFARAKTPAILRETRAEIVRFLAERPDDEQVDTDMQILFDPDILPQGWEQSITNWRQWLARIADLLESRR